MIDTMDKKEVDITPDKSLIKKLGMVGYRTEQAVAELIDNSIDARLDRTEHIQIRLDFEHMQIIVSDDGRGMDLDRLRHALTVAKETKEDGRLGQFGLGMKSACSSLGKAFTLTTSMQDSPSAFIARYDEDKWLNDRSKNWTNFEIEEGHKDFSHGTKIAIGGVRVPMYPNQVLNFRKRFGIRYGPYLERGQVEIRVNSSYCKPTPLRLEGGTRHKIDIRTPSGNRMKGWIGLLEKRSIKGDYGIHIYRNRRLISAFSKFGIRRHPSAARIVGEISLDHVPVNFQKTGFLVESLAYQEAVASFQKDRTVKGIVRSATSHKADASDIKSVLECDLDGNPKPLETRMSAANARSLLRKADRFVLKKGSTDLSFEFDDSDVCSIDPAEDGIRIGIGRNSEAFRLFRNPLFLLGLIRIEAELMADDLSRYHDFVEQRNKRLDKFVRTLLPQSDGRKNTRQKMVPLPTYFLQGELVELHDHLKENFEHGFRFTGLCTLAPFLQNAYDVLVYNMHTVNGAGQDLLEMITDYAAKFTVLLNPRPYELATLLEFSTSDRYIIIREYAERFPSTWAEPERAWLDLYSEVDRDRIPLYGDELGPILDELLETGLANPARLRSLARHRKILDRVEVYLPGE